MDALQTAVMRIAGSRILRTEAFAAIAEIAYIARGLTRGQAQPGQPCSGSDPEPDPALYDRGVVLLRGAWDRSRPTWYEARSPPGHDDWLSDSIVRRGGAAAGRSAGLRERPLRSARRSLVGSSDSGALLGRSPFGRRRCSLRARRAHPRNHRGRRSADDPGCARRRRRSGFPAILPTPSAPAATSSPAARAFQSAGLSTPAFFDVSMADDPAALAATCTYPAVIKPLALAGSRGVMRVDQASDFVWAFERLARLLQVARHSERA